MFDWDQDENLVLHAVSVIVSVVSFRTGAYNRYSLCRCRTNDRVNRDKGLAHYYNYTAFVICRYYYHCQCSVYYY